MRLASSEVASSKPPLRLDLPPSGDIADAPPIERHCQAGSALVGSGSTVATASGTLEESAMISELQIHTIARQMLEKHGFEAIAQAAQNAQACEVKGDADEAREWGQIT